MIRRSIFLILCLLTSVFGVHAQDTGVWVTTQDFVNLRKGPNTAFEALLIVPPTQTLSAIGRSADMQWIQVNYEGQTGWIMSLYLVWSGDIISLPVDGVNPAAFIRRMLVAGETIRETRIYHRELDPSQQVGTIPIDTEVEITARMGEGAFFWLQIYYEETLYWVGSWDIYITRGDYHKLTDISYMFPYGRLLFRADEDIDDNLSILNRIESTWIALSEGQSVTCEFIPAYAERGRAAADIESVPIFVPLFNALDSAIEATNAPIALFEDVCERTEPLTQAEIRQALDSVASARRNYALAYALYISLSGENPLIIIVN